MRKLYLLVFSLLLSQPVIAQDYSVFKSDGTKISILQALQELKRVEQVVIGEKHVTPKVQYLEGLVIDSLKFAPYELGKNVIAWEFLNWSEREQALSKHQDWCSGRASFQDLLNVLFPGTRSSANEAYGYSYLSILSSACFPNTRLLATNLTRAEKAPAVQGGLSAMDPALVPPGFEMGGENYWQRFLQTMLGHAPESSIKNYFVAQSLVDDVMAYHIAEDASGLVAEPALPLKQFVVVGHFHTDYYDGLYARLKIRQPHKTRALITVTDSEEVSEKELPEFIRSKKYGSISDYVIWVN